MEQTGTSRYKVEPNETVTLTITPVQVGPFVAVGVDDTMLENQDGATPVFSFPITKPVGDVQIATVFCNFPGDPPDTAEFDIRVSGSNGGDFVGPVVAKTDPLHTIDIRFRVAAHSGESVASLPISAPASVSREAGAKKGSAKKVSGTKKSKRKR